MKLKKLEMTCFTLLFLLPAFVFSQTSMPNNSHAQDVNDNLSSPRESTDGALMNTDTSNITYSQDTWRQVQSKLNDSNFPVGTADGLTGPRTTEALRNYQRSNNLQITGRLNQETLDAMGIDSNMPSNDMDQEYSE